MSDYFLNKVYNSLLVNKLPKTKSTFRTLSESYGLVYEEEPKTAETTRQQTAQPSQEQQPVQEPNVTKSPEPVQPQPEQPKVEYTPTSLPTDFNVKQRVYPRKQWTTFQQKLFSESAKTGTGRGETSIANLVTNIDNENILKNMVSGGGESYDVAWPPLGMFSEYGKNKKTFKFEVKELEKKDDPLRPKRLNRKGEEVYEDAKDTVTIGVEGRGFAVETLSLVESSLENILRELEAFSPEEQKNISDQVAQKILTMSGRTFVEPKKTDSRGKPRTQTKAYNDELEDYTKNYNAFKNWSLKQYLSLVKQAAKNGEVPLTILLGKRWDRAEIEPKPSGFKGEKSDFFIVSLRRLFKIINELKQQSTTGQSVENEANPRIGSLKDFFYKNYKPSEKEAAPEVVKDVQGQLDKKAVSVDKELSKLKAKSTGYKFAAKDFYSEVPAADTLQLLDKIENTIYARETILNFFPKDLTGFFAVNSKGYIYIPREEIPNYVTLDTFSRGGAKIRLK